MAMRLERPAQMAGKGQRLEKKANARPEEGTQEGYIEGTKVSSPTP
jgi:hypothetical protein